MGILLAYFAFIASTLAVIVTAWIGIAESGAERMHLPHASVIQQSYDASFMAEDSGDTPAQPAAAAKVKGPQTALSSPAPRSRAHVVSRLRQRIARRPDAVSGSYLGAVALRGLSPPDDGH